MQIKQFEQILSQLCESPLSVDEGIKFGDPNQKITGIINCWLFNEEVAEIAKREGCNLILCHEALSVPYGVTEGSPFGGGSNEFLTWPVNRRRTIALVQNDLHFVRFHGHADQVCVFAAFAAQLGLSHVYAPGPLGYDAVYEAPARSVGEWIEVVKAATGMSNLRASVRDASRVVTKIGLPWGGMGLFVNASYSMKLVELGAELLIAGETDNYGFRISQEAGADIIETSHEASENAGIAALGDILRAQLQGLKIVDYCNPCIWNWS